MSRQTFKAVLTIVLLTGTMAVSNMPTANAATPVTTIHYAAVGTTTPGSHVEVTALPSIESGLREAQTMPTLEVASVDADSTGKFGIQPNYSALSSNYYEANGKVTLELYITGPDTTQLTSVEVNPSASTPVTVATTAGANVAKATKNHGPCLAYRGEMGGLAPSFKLEADQHDLWEFFRRGFGRPHLPVHVIQHTGSEHSVGFAVNLDVGEGWQIGGSMSIAVNHDVGAGAQLDYPRKVYNSVNYARLYRHCINYAGDEHWTERQTIPTGWYAFDAHYASTPDPHLSYCIPIYAGGYFELGNGSTATMAGAIGLGYISANVTDTTSKDLLVHWEASGLHGSAPTGEHVNICSDSDAGPNNSAYVAAERPVSAPPGCTPGHPCDAKQ